MRINKPYPLSSQLLKDCRKKTGLEQQQFMKLHNIDISQSVYSRWENGKIAVPVSVLLELGLIRVCDAIT